MRSSIAATLSLLRKMRYEQFMTLETIIAYALAITLFASIPGPGVFAVVAQAIARGPLPAFILLTGIIVGDIAYLVAAAAGLGLLAAKMGSLFAVVKYIGGAYLIWLGWKNWHSHSASNTAKQVSTKLSLLGGFAISISNPKVMIFYIAFLPTFMDVTIITGTDIALLASITTVVSYAVLGVYIVGAGKLRSAVTNPGPQKWFGRFSGAVMAGAGVLVATRN